MQEWLGYASVPLGAGSFSTDSEGGGTGNAVAAPESLRSITPISACAIAIERGRGRPQSFRNQWWIARRILSTTQAMKTPTTKALE